MDTNNNSVDKPRWMSGHVCSDVQGQIQILVPVQKIPITSHADVSCTSLADCSIMTCHSCTGQEQDSGPLHPRVVSTVSRTVAWDYWQRNSPKELSTHTPAHETRL